MVKQIGYKHFSGYNLQTPDTCVSSFDSLGDLSIPCLTHDEFIDFCLWTFSMILGNFFLGTSLQIAGWGETPYKLTIFNTSKFTEYNFLQYKIEQI